MRMSTQAVRQPPKNPMSAASKITKVVTEFFLPLADNFVPDYTPLTATPDAEENLLLEKIWEMFPECMRTRDAFVAKMGELYDSSRALSDSRDDSEAAAPLPKMDCDDPPAAPKRSEDPPAAPKRSEDSPAAPKRSEDPPAASKRAEARSGQARAEAKTGSERATSAPAPRAKRCRE
jgi:hypothetical protein